MASNTLTPAFLKQLHTRKLLKVLRKCCVTQEQLNEWYTNVFDALPELAKESNFTTDKKEYEKRTSVPASAFGFEDWVTVEISIADLKAELATRPHIPNKIEAKAQRREKNRKNRGKGRANR